MANKKEDQDLFAPPSQEELQMFSAPTPEELGQPSTVGGVLGQKVEDLGQSLAETGKSALQTGLETTADVSRGLFQGLTLGGSDEAIAAIKAARDVALTDKESKDWKDLYRRYQQEEQAKVQSAQERSPIASTLGEIGGSILPAIFTAGAALPATGAAVAKLGAKELAKKATKAGAIAGTGGAVYGGLSSEEGKLIGSTPEEQEKLKADIVGGAVTGGALGAGLSAVAQVVPPIAKAAKEKISSKVENYIEDSPFFRQLRKSKELGEEGINVSSDKAKYGVEGKLGLISRDTENTKDLMNRIYQVDDQLGKNVGKVIDDATGAGVTINLEDELYNTAKEFEKIYQTDATIAANPKARKLYEQIFQLKKDNVTPKEIQSLRDKVVEFSDSIKQQNPTLAYEGYKFQGAIGNKLKQVIPEYKVAAERFESFRRLVPETIISGSTPVDVTGVKLGRLKNQDAKLFGSLRGMIQGATKPGVATKDEAETFVNFIKGLKQFEGEEAQRVKQGIIKEADLPKMAKDTTQSQAKSMEKLIKDKADESAMLQQVWGVNPQEGPTSVLKGALAGISSTGRGVSMNLANKYGLYKDTLLKPVKAPVELTKKLSQASETELRSIGEKLSEIPGSSSIGKALINGLDNKDQAGINAAIFSIMQNPQARILINAEQLDQETEE